MGSESTGSLERTIEMRKMGNDTRVILVMQVRIFIQSTNDDDANAWCTYYGVYIHHSSTRVSAIQIESFYNQLNRQYLNVPLLLPLKIS